jgi:hypothetical protein
MDYKDNTFEVDNTQIKIRKNTFIGILPSLISTALVFGFIGLKHDILSILIRVFGAVSGYCLVFVFFMRAYWKSTIDLRDIAQIKIVIWDNNIDKNRYFFGTPKYRYHFPGGLNKKNNQVVIFVEKRGSKLAVGFVPENLEMAIEVFKERGIKIVDKRQVLKIVK